MAILDRQQQQTIDRNFSLVVSFLDSKFDKTHLKFSEVPSYLYKGKESKLEIIVFANPRIAKIDVRMISLNNYDREPSFEDSYDLDGLSINMFESSINDLISTIN